MLHRFGDFTVDEDRRELRLGNEALAVQPKIFDLLVMLLVNAGRVIPKAELLEKVWPGVFVSEASLQRAVSLLRTELKKGGLDRALKNYSGRGYRLAIDQPELDEFWPKPVEAGNSTENLQGLANARKWSEIVRLLGKRAMDSLSAEELELYAYAEECLGRAVAGEPFLRRLIEISEAAGDVETLSRTAVSLSRIHFERGARAVSRGWLAQVPAGELDKMPSVKASFLWMQSRLSASDGSPQEARDLVAEAHRAAEASGHKALRAVTLAYLGFFNISLGHIRQGLEQQDHAAALAMSTAVDPVSGGLVYCSVLWSCRSSGDWARAMQWIGGYETWCEGNFASVSAACQLHRAEIDGVQGTLPDALTKIQKLIEMSGSEPWARHDGYRVRGDIHAALGDETAARRDYQTAYEMGGDAEPGHAILLADAGDTDGAISALDRVLVNTDWYALQRRAILLGYKARICAAAGRGQEARAVIDEMRAQYETWPSKAVHALVLEAEALLLAQGEDGMAKAIQLLHLARQLWTSAEAEYQAARVRILLSRMMQQQGDSAGAQVEARCAETAAGKIGAARLLDEAAGLVVPLGGEREAAAISFAK